MPLPTSKGSGAGPLSPGTNLRLAVLPPNTRDTVARTASWHQALCRPSKEKASHTHPVWAAPLLCLSHPLGLAVGIWASPERNSRQTEVDKLGF